MRVRVVVGLCAARGVSVGDGGGGGGGGGKYTTSSCGKWMQCRVRGRDIGRE